ncbi:MAG TPA: tetratricopeptide repeat protein, partial [Chitinophagales bacterium]|nr:tetratricopeptide repeat protein [Chitinophagales bacterium]
IAPLYLNIGDLYKDQKNYDEALRNYFESIKTSEKTGNEIILAASYVQIGSIYEAIGDLSKALKYETVGLEYAKNTDQKDKIKNAYRILAVIHAKNKNYKEAFESEQLYLLTYEEIFNMENEKNITKLQMQYEFEKKEAEAKAKHDQEVALAQKETEYQKSIRNYIFMGMGVIVLFFIVLLIQRNKIAKERKQKALEQERSRISRDLHDDLGSGLTGILMMSDQIQATDNKELIGNSVEKIKNSSRYMVDQMGEIIWAMNAKNDTMENLFSYIHTYALDYFENQDIKLQISLPEKTPDIVMSGMMRRNIFLVVKESLNNITKHAHATEVSMKIELNGSGVNINFLDNGKGFEMEKTRKFGNGLKNMESRMTDINGTFRIESVPGKGAKTFISFPLS